MILIENKPVEADTISNQYPENSIERDIINKISLSNEKYKYDTLNQLKFELRLRKEIVNAAKALNKSSFSFEVFRKSKCNPAYWERTDEGGFILKDGVKPSDAINDIFIHGSKYASECATALVIVYYKALLNIFGEELFNEVFPKIQLMNWSYIDENLKEIGIIRKAAEPLSGDRRYFANPDVNPLTPEWQGENVIDLDNQLYYGHGIGIHNADTIIHALNKYRKKDADESAYLMDSVAYPNFKKLSDIYYSHNTSVVGHVRW